MTWGATAAAAGAIGGSLLSGNAAKSAANTAANAQLQSAQIAADAQKFRPVGVTSRFGSSNFGFDENGYLNEAGYTASPELLGYQDFLSGQGPQTQQDVAGLLSLGRGYIGEDPNAVKQRYIQQQRALLAPENEQALAGIRNNLFQQGRGGLATGATNEGGMAATNPEMAAYYNALAKQNAALTAGAEQAAQQQIGFGQGLLSSAYSPLQTNVGLNATFEELAQQPLTIGTNLGGQSAQFGANVGQTLMTGGTNAANAMYKANSYSPWGSAISGAFSNPQVQSALRQPSGGQLGTWSNTTQSQAQQNEISGLGSNTWNPYSDYNTGANGWGNYGE
jgi:hypothetical protein